MDGLVTRLEKAGAHASHTHELRGLLTDCTLAAHEITKLRSLLRELIDIDGPQPGTAAWADKARAALAQDE
jgi:hypothetical protein